MKNLLFIILLIFVGCCGKDIPKGTDSDVKKLVIDICNEEFQNQLMSNAIISELGMAPRIAGNPSYDDWKNSTDESKQRVIKKVDKLMSEINLSLSSIRTISENKDINKIRCAAELMISNENKKKIDIEYTAQYTEDGKLYVEVFGLR